VYVPYFEGFGIPIVEAQASGCPVLTSNVSSMPEVAGAGGALLVDPHHTESIAAGLARLWNEADLRQALVAQGQENLRRFSWAQSAEVLWQAITKAVVKNEE
jgi:glycosyltransferase involved in cell wall biosynthesis